VPARTFRFHPAAELELNEAAEWYEERTDGLGLAFLGAVRAKIGTVLEAPQRWRLVNGSRRVLLGRFPYAVVYREVSPEEIEIIALAHYRRRPKYWAGR
jgi:plasmid stabilization system protein ParE